MLYSHIVVDCGDLDDPENGQVSMSGTKFGSQARYRCFPGYTLQGVTNRLCEDDGLWTGDPPRCVCECMLVSVIKLMCELFNRFYMCISMK